jgi:hypothetical protein
LATVDGTKVITRHKCIVGITDICTKEQPNKTKNTEYRTHFTILLLQYLAMEYVLWSIIHCGTHFMLYPQNRQSIPQLVLQQIYQRSHPIPTAMVTRRTIPISRKIKVHPETKQEMDDERELAEALALLSLPNN